MAKTKKDLEKELKAEKNKVVSLAKDAEKLKGNGKARATAATKEVERLKLQFNNLLDANKALKAREVELKTTLDALDKNFHLYKKSAAAAIKSVKVKKTVAIIVPAMANKARVLKSLYEMAENHPLFEEYFRRLTEFIEKRVD